MSGRRVGTLAFLALAVVAGSIWWLASPRVEPARPPWLDRVRAATLRNRPNVLLVVYDARRRDDFSLPPDRSQRGDTPFLEEFSRDALYFPNAISPGTWTLPVHASLFSGLTVCDLGVEHYNPGFGSFRRDFLSLAEILRLSGYRTMAWADHPFFLSNDIDLSLVRGFEFFDVVMDFEEQWSYSNVSSGGGAPTRRSVLKPRGDPPIEAVRERIVAFNEGRPSVDANTAHLDAARGIRLAPLYERFLESPFFERRYERDFRRLIRADAGSPFFLFLNLHMATIMHPDRVLYADWFLDSLMLTARHRGRQLTTAPEARRVGQILAENFRRLGLDHEPFPTPHAAMKHLFDNRFYDATFRRLWEYLVERGVADDTAVFVTSDHGMSFGENGEAFYLHEGARPNEYIVRAPLVVRFPPSSKAAGLHRVRTEPVSLVDLFPTIVELALGRGVFERPLPIRGESLISRVVADHFEDVLVSESALVPTSYRDRPGSIGYASAIYSKGYKLIYANPLLETGGQSWPNTVRLGDLESQPALQRPVLGQQTTLTLLYDLESDPGENVDLSERRPEVVEELLRGWSAGPDCTPLVGDAQSAEWSGDALDTLRALGYVQ